MNADTFTFTSACAARKHQKKKCDSNCELAPYFPSTKAEDFKNVYRLFGVSNTIKHLNSVADDQKAQLIETLILEAKFRKENPVHGCLAVKENLGKKLKHAKRSLKWCKIIFHFVRK